MDDATRLAIIRQAFAQRLSFETGILDPRVEAAFAAVPREDFLGPGPWQTVLWPRTGSDAYIATPSADPAWLYMDCIFAILPERHVNNGQPALHAKLIAEAPIKDGDHVVHVGLGTGYYTAIMAHLAGPSGKVTAIEFDPALAMRARQNLASLTNVSVVQGDGCTAPFDAADVIYVNAGVTRPAEAWLDRLKVGGRLIIPLTGPRGFRTKPPPVPIDRRGAVFRIERQSAGYLARWLSPVAIIPCEGGRDAVSEAALEAALKKGGWERVTRLYRNAEVPEDRSWLRAPGWTLAYS
ncbi:MAG: methyltransferase domain-containing protein [Hyphomicrobiaceae bacterium]|nr:methyltransferase domain-containing protein [Hyphomicrobiaceae bacterium]